jgi:para-aminobenzoate synthetase component 1
MQRAKTLKTKTLSGVHSLAPLAQLFSDQNREFVWLDSAQGHPERGRYSVLCLTEEGGYRLNGQCARNFANTELIQEMRAAYLKDRKPCQKGVNEDGFLGGWIGYISYEAQIDFDRAFPGREACLPYPRLCFKPSYLGATLDHRKQRLILWSWSWENESNLFEEWTRTLSSDNLRSAKCSDDWSLSGELNANWHQQSVSEILKRIFAGEIYQANLTAPIEVKPGLNPLNLYFKLRKAAPSDFAAYLSWPELKLLSSSPERFFCLKNGIIRSRPMKGTRPRNKDKGVDQALKSALAASAKDRAENLMIVDLVRNDLGRVAETGSIEVTDLFSVESYSTVYQMTSGIQAELKKGKDVFHALEALFPPGSMTGAPKVQATRVIRQIEPDVRGIYSGTIGMIDWQGNGTFNVVIRTLVLSNNRASWSVGGGIVADSSAAEEYREALDKLRAFKRALDL